MSLLSKLKKRKEEITYIALILVFILFIFTVTITFLEINLREQGISDIRNNYYSIDMLNATIDFETTSKIKLDNEEKIIKVFVNDLNKYNNGNTFKLELYNIGNTDAEISDILVTYIDTNVEEDKVDVSLSLKKGMIIESSEKKTLSINIKYNENKPNINDYYNFDVKISYREVVK